MSNIKFGYYNPWDIGTIAYTSQHYNFPASNSQERRLTSPWRSAYEENVGGGYFEITAANKVLYFNEGAGIIQAFIPEGIYSAQALAEEIEIQMDAVGTHDYDCEYDFNTFKFTISDNTGIFLLGIGSTVQAIWETIGYVTFIGYTTSHEADNIRIHTHEYIQVSLTALAAFDGLFIFNHNIQTTGILKWQFSNNNFVSIPLEISPTRSGNIAVSLLAAVQSYQYMRIYIEDIDNPAGYVQIGRAWLSEMFTPTIGYNAGGSENPVDKSILTEALSGEAMSIQYPHVERRSYRFDIAEPYAGFKSMYDLVGRSKPIVVVTRENVPDSLSFDNPELYTLYCRMSNYSKNTIGGPRYKVNLSVREEK